jgi:hypothetical protein
MDIKPRPYQSQATSLTSVWPENIFTELYTLCKDDWCACSSVGLAKSARFIDKQLK